MTKKGIILGVSAVVVAAGAAYFFMPKSAASSTPQWITSAIEKENIVKSITATGTIEPVTVVDVGTQVSGILTTLYVDYNSVVKKGEVIAELDKSTLILDLQSNKNNMAEAKALLDYELGNYTRSKKLYDSGLISDSEYELELYNYTKAQNDYAVAKNTVARSEINLGYATIYSPIDGVVLSRAVEEGQTVASSFSTPTLFTIAADLTDMRVIADVDEADIGDVEEGQKVTFTVDAYPTETFEGFVTQVRQEAIIESNVVTYEVVISAANPDLKLKPGLTASVEVFTLDAECELVVPASALSFDPGFDMPEDGSEGGVGAPSGQGMGQGGPGMGGPGGMMGQGKSKGTRAPKTGMQTIWIKNGDLIEPRRVEVGITNGISAEIIGRDITVQDSVVLGIANPSILEKASGTTNPFMPQRPGSKR
ncbi:MAG: efflux RND transporter periplasmic adaptor subunit [Rikenellaceae bacterium]